MYVEDETLVIEEEVKEAPVRRLRVSSSLKEELLMLGEGNHTSEIEMNF
jgi:hypothetical protein